MAMAAVMDGATTAGAGIITGGAEVVATTMVGGIIAITGDNSPVCLNENVIRRPTRL